MICKIVDVRRRRLKGTVRIEVECAGFELDWIIFYVWSMEGWKGRWTDSKVVLCLGRGRTRLMEVDAEYDLYDELQPHE